MAKLGGKVAAAGTVGKDVLGAAVIDRLKQAEVPEQIILCTSTLAEDDELTRIAEGESISFFRGSHSRRGILSCWKSSSNLLTCYFRSHFLKRSDRRSR